MGLSEKLLALFAALKREVRPVRLIGLDFDLLFQIVDVSDDLPA